MFIEHHRLRPHTKLLVAVIEGKTRAAVEPAVFQPRQFSFTERNVEGQKDGRVCHLETQLAPGIGESGMARDQCIQIRRGKFNDLFLAGADCRLETLEFVRGCLV
jgi:hypothetical protein